MAATTTEGTFRLADVFGKSVAIYRRGVAPFTVLTIFASLPTYIILYAIGTPDEGRNLGAAAVSMGQNLLLVVTQTLASGAVIYGVVQLLRGRTFSIADSIQVALRRLLPMVGVAICTTVAMVLGLLVLIIPGIILGCMYYVSMPACIAEQTGVFESMSRSSFLTEGRRWQVFGASLLYWVAAAIFGGIYGAVFDLVFPEAGQVGTLVGTEVPMVVVNAFGGVLIGVFYYELRVAKEGVDIDKIAGVFD
jgi:hypothetical protein